MPNPVTKEKHRRMEEELEQVPKEEKNEFRRLVEKIVRTIENNNDESDEEQNRD